MEALYTAELPTSPGSLTATFADDTAIITTDSDPAVASQIQTDLLAIQNWLKMENNSERNQVDPCHLHYATCGAHTGPYQRCATPPNGRRQISLAPPGQKTYLA
jgi:hypothetical protein